MVKYANNILLYVHNMLCYVMLLLFHERGNPFSRGWYKWGTLKLQLKIREAVRFQTSMILLSYVASYVNIEAYTN